MKIKKIMIFALLILCFVSISAVNAEDMANASQTSDINDEIVTMVNNDDVLAFEEVIYFNASSANDGDGSKANPYKYVTNARIEYGDTAYFANGVYEIDELIDIYSNSETTQVKFYGESAEGTILKSTFGTVPIFVNDNARLYVWDMTFDCAVIQNQGTLEAHNVIFKNGRGADAYYTSPEYNDIFGGAIYSPGSIYFAGYGMPSYLTLDNCTFMNNSAVYGGSIYHKNGVTVIKNSKFYDSHSQLYGGVLATDGGSIIIENCIFDDCYAEGDAGGAIYAKVTNLTVKNTDFSNGHGDFGGAICNLNAVLDISNCNFNNNTAKLEGGAIYQMYGKFSLRNSNITLAEARDGGAIFIDNCTSTEMNNVKIKDTSAIRKGGAIFSNNNNLVLNDVGFENNVAGDDTIIHDQKGYEYDIDYNSNYTMMKYNSSYTGVLPSRYSLVENGLSTPIRDQQAGGNCWAFAGIAALESCILKATGISYDLSEENVKNLVELYSAYGWKYSTNEGGHDEMTYGNLLSWIGPVLESDDKYDDLSTLSTLLDPVMHVQNVYYLPARTSYSDNDAMKRAILDYGAVAVNIFMDQTNPLVWNEDKAAYYYVFGGYSPNHAVTIVGWDDTYPKSNFPMGDMAECDGAWIVKNSWGTGWGDEGYFYVSYCDPIVYALNNSHNAYTFILNDTVRYNRNYQYDIGGMTDFLITHEKTVYYKNTFTSIGNDILSAFGTFFEQNCNYEVSLFINDELVLTQNGSATPGYYTIPFDTEFLLNVGDNFTIQIRIDAPSMASFPIFEIVTASRLTYGEGISYFSYDAKNWIDCFDYVFDDPEIEHRYASQVACIKAYTRSSGLNTTSIKVNNIATQINAPTVISAIVRDQNNELIENGSVMFTINGNNYLSTISNGIANLTLAFNETGIVYVFASYLGNDQHPQANTTSKITVNKLDPNLELNIADIIVDSPLTANIIMNDEINGNVSVLINGKSYNVSVSKGKGTVEIKDEIAVGKYDAVATFDGDDKYSSATSQTSFNVTKKDINLGVDAKNVVEGDLAIINVNLVPDADGEISVVIAGKSYTAKANNGIATVEIPDLPIGAYDFTVEYKKDSKYNDATANSTLNVVDSDSKVILNASDVIKYYGGSQRLSVTMSDNAGNPISGETIIILINGVKYNRTTDSEGLASIALNLNRGEYAVEISYLGNDKYAPESITVNVFVKDTIFGENLTKVYRNDSQYYATFLDVNGNPLKTTQVSFNINGVFYNRTTDENGVARLNINLNPGEYILTAINSNTTEQYSNTIVVLSRFMDNHNIIKYYKNDTQYVVRVIGDDGNPIAGEKVTFNINGVFYSRISNATGHVKLNINLPPGDYIITAEYKGCMVSNNIHVISVLYGEDMTKNYGSSDQFKARVLDGVGNPLADAMVEFNINGVFYNRTTASNGVASLNINLMAGEYIITSIYNGYSISNKITIL